MKVYTIVLLIGALAFVSADDVTTIKIEPEPFPTSTVKPEPPPSPAPTPKPTSIPPTKPTEPPITPTPSTTTMAPPPTTPPTTKPTTPTPPTPSTKPTTPAPAPPPTTKPTTPAPAPPPTTKPTPAPTTSTTPSTPTTPAPKPTPKEPEVGKWSLNYTDTDNNNTLTQFSCMIVQLALQTEVHYSTTGNTTAVAYVNLPKNATVSGSCDSDPKSLSESMILTWNVNNTITLTFKKENKSSKFYVDEVAVALRLPQSNLSYNLVHQRAEFNTSGAKSYKCDKVQNLILSGAENKTEIHVSHVQMQAFTNTTNGAFHEAEDCQPFETPDVVPIAVGCSLVILVVIVLAAYLIGRRRREGRGYLSIDAES